MENYFLAYVLVQMIVEPQYIKAKKREELKRLIGSYDEFGLSLKDLEQIRREE